MAFEIVDGMTGTKHISSDDLAALNTATVGKASCVLDYGNDFSLTMASANAATLGTGVGMVGGKRFWNQAPVQLTVESGAQGKKRNDLVVARYAKTSAGIESIEPVVIKGTPTTGTAADPAVTANDLKLWRIPINGITVGTPAKLFSPVTPLATLGDSVSPKVLKPNIAFTKKGGDLTFAIFGNVVCVNLRDLVIGKDLNVNTSTTLASGLPPAIDGAQQAAILSLRMNANSTVWTLSLRIDTGGVLTVANFSQYNIGASDKISGRLVYIAK